jgi:large subunit ribosomal protein L25
MSTISLEAEARLVQGKGASRRLRRLENKIPGILYGGEKAAQLIHLQQNKVFKALEHENIFSSVFDLHVNGKVEHVILKDMQRHPYKPVILHMDFQRVSAKDILVKLIPLHFINEQNAPGFKKGGVINHTMTQVEVRCQAKYLPEFIEVDLNDMDLDEVLHLSDLKLPSHVQLTIDPFVGDHDHPVVGIHVSRASLSDLAEEEAEAEAEEAVEEEQALEQKEKPEEEKSAE